MEAMAEDQSSRWLDESIIEYEIQFYLKYPELEAEIKDRIKENELDIQFPVTRYDELGVYLFCPSTESQAIKRIEVREGLDNALKRMRKRIERFDKAFCNLSEEDRELIDLFYFESYPESRIARLLGFKNVREMRQARKKALLKMLKVYNEERKQRDAEEKLTREELKRRKAEALKESMENARKQLNRKFGGLFQ